MTTLVWFRNDLRVADHAPLRAAAASGPVLAVYCVDMRAFGRGVGDQPRLGAHRARFLIESIGALRKQLRGLGGDLVVRVGPPEQVLPALASEVGATVIRFHHVVGTEEATVEHALAQVCAAAGIALRADLGATLHHPDDLPFAPNAVPELFTRFRTELERSGSRPRAPLPAPAALSAPPFSPGALPTQADLGLAEPLPDSRATLTFSGGADAGHARLRHYIWVADRLRVYKHTRNGMLAPDDASRLSPWLALGCLSPREVFAEVQRYEDERVRNESTYWLIFELLWRDYFHFILAKHGARLYQPGGPQRLSVRWRRPDQDDAASRDFAAWRDGRTGFPLIDANMRELAATGFMSNRGRQNVASFLAKNLGIDWRWGAAHFEAQLLDYDTASNYGNWCYAAGVRNDARGFRFFNTHKQADDYDPTGDYARHWLPELAGVRGGRVHRPELLTVDELRRGGIALGETYPRPMVDLFASARANEAIYNAARKAHA